MPETVHVSLRIPVELKSQLAKMANAEQRSLSNFILHHLSKVATDRGP